MLTRARYLEILETASVEDHPYLALPDSDEIGAAFVTLAHSLAAFVKAAEAHEELGYDFAVQELEDVVHAFPDNAQDSLLAGLLEAIATDRATDGV